MCSVGVNNKKVVNTHHHTLSQQQPCLSINTRTKGSAPRAASAARYACARKNSTDNCEEGREKRPTIWCNSIIHTCCAELIALCCAVLSLVMPRSDTHYGWAVNMKRTERGGQKIRTITEGSKNTKIRAHTYIPVCTSWSRYTRHFTYVMMSGTVCSK